MNYEYRGVTNLHRARTHSSFLLNPFARAFYYFLLLWIQAQKAISAPELFREETDYVIMEKTVFYQLIWQIQAQTLSSSLVSHLDYCDIPLSLLWFIFLWFQPFKAQAAKHRNEQPLVYWQHFSFWSLLLLFLVYHNFSKGSISASLILLLFVPRTTQMLRKSWVQWNELQSMILLLRAEIVWRVSQAKKVDKKALLRSQGFFVVKLKVASLHV